MQRLILKSSLFLLFKNSTVGEADEESDENVFEDALQEICQTVGVADEESDEEIFEDTLQEHYQLNAKVDQLMSRPAELADVSCSAPSRDTRQQCKF